MASVYSVEFQVEMPLAKRGRSPEWQRAQVKFLFADVRASGDRDQTHKQLLETGMTLLEKQDITPHVLEALRLDSERKLALIQRSVNKRLVVTFRQFAAIEGSDVFGSFRDGTAIYLRYALRKQK